MIPRKEGLDISQVEKPIKDYLDVNPELLEKRRYYVLLKVLDFMKNDLGVSSVSDLLKFDAKTLTLSLQRYVVKAASGELGKKLKPKSIKYNVYLARTFFSFYDIEINSKKIKIPNKGAASRIDRIPSIAQLQKLILGTRSAKMRLAIMLMALCGLRLGEVFALRREWIDLERGFITLPAEATKAKRPREIPIPSELKAELKRYLEKYPHEKGVLLCVEGDPEKPFPVARFRERYKKLLKRVGLDEKTPDGSAHALHPHVFRKWYRTQLEAAGVNKLLIDLWMGHNSGIEKYYYLPTPEMIKQEIEKADKVLRIFGQYEIESKINELEEEIKKNALLTASLMFMFQGLKSMNKDAKIEGVLPEAIDVAIHALIRKKELAGELTAKEAKELKRLLKIQSNTAEVDQLIFLSEKRNKALSMEGKRKNLI